MDLLPAILVDKAREVVDTNRAAGRRIAVAESCTGGLVSAAITEIPGSSDVFEAGYVTYSNAAKLAGLKVSQNVVETFGAVSIAVAWAMALGALEASGADVAVAITGVAGPDGGTKLQFSVDFAFRSRIFEAIAGQMFDRALRRMTSAFEERAAVLYGSSSSSSAQSAA